MGKRTAAWVEIPCDNCGKLFEKRESRLKYSKRHYCSVDCSNPHTHKMVGKRTATWVEIPCDNCGKLFEKKESRLKYSKRHYCSNDCSDQHKKVTMKGKNNHRFGTKSKESTIKKQRASMKERWKNDTYRQKRAEGHRKAMENRDCWFGCKPEEKERARRKVIENYWGVPYGEHYELMEARDAYYYKVWEHTNKQDLQSLENFEKRGRIDLKEDAYHLDHIIPISYGFLNNVPVEIIADISNLRFIPARDNLAKSSKHEGELWRSDDEEIQD